MEGAPGCAQKIFRDGKEHGTDQGLGRKRAKKAAIKKVIGGMEWSFAFMDAIGLSAIAYVSNGDGQDKPRKFTTSDVVDYDKLLTAAGFGRLWKGWNDQQEAQDSSKAIHQEDQR